MQSEEEGAGKMQRKRNKTEGIWTRGVCRGKRGLRWRCVIGAAMNKRRDGECTLLTSSVPCILFPLPLHGTCAPHKEHRSSIHGKTYLLQSSCHYHPHSRRGCSANPRSRSDRCSWNTNVRKRKRERQQHVKFVCCVKNVARICSRAKEFVRWSRAKEAHNEASWSLSVHSKRKTPPCPLPIANQHPPKETRESLYSTEWGL